MNNQHQRKLASCLLAGALLFWTMPTIAADREALKKFPHTGTVELKLEYVFAFYPDLQAATWRKPEYDAACKEQLSLSASKYLGMVVKVSYAIAADSQVTAFFPSPNTKESKEYKFDIPNYRNVGAPAMSERHDDWPFFVIREYTGSPSGLNAIEFGMDELEFAFKEHKLYFGDPYVSFTIRAPEGQKYLCEISSLNRPPR